MSTKMGFDLVAFSGGKGLRGPQTPACCWAARTHRGRRPETTRTRHTIGRSKKVSKEEMVGMWSALEPYPQEGPREEWREWEQRTEVIRESAAAIKGVTAEIRADRQPRAALAHWDAAARASAAGVRQGCATASRSIGPPQRTANAV